jgi:hypothetical protein
MTFEARDENKGQRLETGGTVLFCWAEKDMDNLLALSGVTHADLFLLLRATQGACAILTVGLLMNWLKNRHAGVLLSSGVFGFAAYSSYFSLSNNDWWPLGVAFAASTLLKGAGFQMGYH